MKRSTLVIIVIVATCLVQTIGWILFMYSGAYNVSTSNHDFLLMNWGFATGTRRSIVTHARFVTAPSLADPTMVQDGFRHFDEMCVQCHGAPGKSPGEIAEGLWPKPPDLGKAAAHWTPAQLFWITKNGIKFSAMPAWGPSHDDDKIWAITAFLEKLPAMSAADYRAMETNAKAVREVEN